MTSHLANYNENKTPQNGQALLYHPLLKSEKGTKGLILSRPGLEEYIK